MNKKQIQNRIKYVEKVRDMLNWGYLKEIEMIREIGLSQESEDEEIHELRVTHSQADKDLKEEVSKLLDEYYKK